MADAVPGTSGDGGEPPSALQLIHGLSNLPDGYGTTLLKCCI